MVLVEELLRAEGCTMVEIKIRGTIEGESAREREAFDTRVQGVGLLLEYSKGELTCLGHC
jgi:hypothetical protein